MRITQITPASSVVEPISVDELKEHLNYETNERNVYLEVILKAARNIAEQYIDGVIADRQFQAELDDFCSTEIVLPFSQIDPTTLAIAYDDTEDAPQTFTNFDYKFEFGKLVLIPANGYGWPATSSNKRSVRITFTAGFSHETGAIPEAIKHGIMMIAGSMDENREDHTHAKLESVPISSKFLLDPYKAQLS